MTVAACLIGTARGYGEGSRWSGLETRFGIEIVENQPFPVQSSHGQIAAKPAKETELAHYAAILNREFSLYPASFVKRSQLRKISLCADLSFAGQKRWAVPEFEQLTLYLDVRNDSDDYLRNVLHHDFFHFIDRFDDEQLETDPRWSALNPDGFRYGNGGASVLHIPSTGKRTDRYPGFLNHYSTTAVEEDKAEIFCYLMVDPGYLAKRTKTDPVIKEKISAMKELAANASPEMDATFWERIYQLRKAIAFQTRLRWWSVVLIGICGIVGLLCLLRRRLRGRTVQFSK